MGITVDQLEKRIQEGWEKFPEPRPFIFIKKETYLKLKSPAVFIDAEFGEWEATADGVMRGGMHPKRRQRDFTKINITKDEFYELYFVRNMSVNELATHFGCHRVKVIEKIKEFDLKKPMELKQELMAKTNRERYGVDNVMQNSEIHNKAMQSRDIEKFKASYKSTMQEKYGVDNGFQDKGITERAKQTMLEKFGSHHALKVDSCREKYKKTIRKKYKDDTLEWVGFNVDEIKAKTSETNQTNLGVDSPFQSKAIQDKVKETVLEKYGVDHITKAPEIKAKIRHSILSKFGGKHHLSDPDIRELIKKTSLKKYGCICSLQNTDIMKKSYETRKKNDSFNKSKPEKEIRDYIQSLVTDDVKCNVRDIISPYELDIVIPSMKLAIEYNGLYHHSEAKKDNDYHVRKLKLCTDAGYRLIQIFAHEWHYSKTAVKSRIRAILHCNENIIGARNTKCELASFDEVIPFLNEFHIQGGARFEKALKLHKDGLILAVMTFSRHHRQNSNALVLNRYCVRDNYSIIGGAAKLLKHANIKEPIISYSDNRWSSGDIYRQLNFKLDAHIRHDYFYFKGLNVFSKQSMKKTKEEVTSGKSEHELRLEQGYLRVYDCGKQRWKLDVKEKEST